jgi:hypothetical protein
MDSEKIGALITLASTKAGIARAQKRAKKAWPPFPHNGCAANLSALLQLADIYVPMTLGAGNLAYIMRDDRGWKVIAPGKQNVGDIGVTFDEGGNVGADHIYLVVGVVDADEMTISDNQYSDVHVRFVSGKGKTRTEYFLRSTASRK